MALVDNMCELYGKGITRILAQSVLPNISTRKNIRIQNVSIACWQLMYPPICETSIINFNWEI